MIQIFGTSKCKATRAAERFFKDRGIRVQSIDLKVKGMSRGELESVAKSVGGPAALLDMTGVRAKEKGLHVSAPTGPRIVEALLNDPLLLRTPVVRDGGEAAVGENTATWKRFAERAKSG